MAAGWYRVTYNRTGWCNGATKDFEVLECSPSVFPTFVVSSDCGTNASGTISITNADPDNTYLWSNGATTQNLTDVAAGTYTVVITETNTNCAYSETIVIEEAQPLVVTDIVPLCPGSIAFNFNVSGGNPTPSNYVVLDNTTGVVSEPINIPIANGTVINNLPTDYTIIITSSSSCEYTYSGNWVDYTPECNGLLNTTNPADADHNGVNVLCTPNGDGTQNMEVIFYLASATLILPINIWYENTGGILGHNAHYVIQSNRVGVTLFNLDADEANQAHCIVVTDGNGCVITYGSFSCSETPVSIANETPTPCCNATFTAQVSPILRDCNGNTLQTGSAHIVSNDGCNIYTVNGSPAQYLHNLSAGNHNATIGWYSSCPGTPTQTISFNVPVQTIEPQWDISADLNPAYTPCSYPDEGTVTFQDFTLQHPALGLQQADRWAWSDGIITSEPFRFGLLAQTYTVTITHSPTGCSTVRTYNMAQASNYGYHAQISPALTDCYGNVLQNGGVAILSDSPCPITYQIKYNGVWQNSHTLTQLGIGSYSVGIRTTWYTQSDDSTPDYTEQILTFFVNGQVSNGSWNIEADIIPSTLGCLGDMNTGSIDLSNVTYTDGINGNPSDLTFEWYSCSGSSQCFKDKRTQLPSGWYDVRIKATTTGCSILQEFYVGVVAEPTEPIVTDDLSVVIQHAHSGCGTDLCDGEVNIEVSGGSGNYRFDWSDGNKSNNNILSADNPNPSICHGAWHGSLCSDNYSVTVTDTQTGCTAQTNFSIGLYITQSNSQILTYPSLYGDIIKPDIKLAPSLFDSQTKINYRLPEDGFVTIRVYNTQGILIETLVSNEYRNAGEYQLNDEGGTYANGAYLFSLEVCDKNEAVIGIKY